MVHPRAFLSREYGPATDLVGTLSSSESISRIAAEHLIRRAGERIQRTLGGTTANPLEVTSAGVRAKGIAGVVELSPGVELEIAPKYAASAHAGWREDLLFLAMFSKYGELLADSRVSAGAAAANDLSDLAAKVVLRMFYGNRRSPLRVRSMQQYSSFEYESDIDPDDLLIPTEAGFPQRAYAFTRDNEFSATLARGAETLLSRVRSSPLRAQLSRMKGDIGPQSAHPSKVRRRLPSRLRHWQPLYDLCFELSRDSGLAPGGAGYLSPGFVLSTWQTWQDVIEKSLMLAFGASAVENQAQRVIGKRVANGKTNDVNCFPDSVLTVSGHPFVIDAKYKGEGDEGFDHISNADIYESLAFANAAGAKKVVLVYPRTDDSTATGSCYVAEVVSSGSVQIHALCIQINGVARPVGLLSFVKGLRTSLAAVLTP